MADPVSKVSGPQPVGTRSGRTAGFVKGQAKEHPRQADDDNVDISESARERLSGKRHRTILEFIEEED